ncbi:MAG: glutamate--tRNA ligase, partial [Candidatus Thermoplasmatota archaeon]|nr:glutamate--tRNA ligase [Candidatus Thermoplasmatota archaeon]
YAGSEVHGEKKRIIHWVGEHSSKFTVLKPDGTEDHGLLESEAVDKIGIIQLERYSFVNKVSESRALFLHR